MKPAKSGIEISVTVKAQDIAMFHSLLQQGFLVTARVGCDLQSLLCDQFGMLPDYLADRINTIFLNGRPVDEPAEAVVHDGDTLALSAAMPGLVGATLRKGGCLAAFRESITFQAQADGPAACGEGRITLKLFNLLIGELGPSFLARGIGVSGAMLNDCWNASAAEIQTAADKVVRNGRSQTADQAFEAGRLPADTRVLLQVSMTG